jgi:hypothetical protein
MYLEKTMDNAIELPTREATDEEMDRMSAHSLFLYLHGVELYIYGKSIFSLFPECLPKGIKVSLRNPIELV